MKTKSKLFRLDLKDIGKGLLLAVLSSVVPLLMTDLSAEVVTVDWNAMRMVAMGAISAYLATNFFSNSKGKIGKKEGK